MKNPKTSCYNVKSVNSKQKHKIGMSIIVPFLQVFDTFHYMDKVLNATNKKSDTFWSLEEHYNPINTLFLLCEIEDEAHKDVLFNLIYDTATKKLGDKNFKHRAKEILALMKMTLKRLTKKEVSK